MTYKLKNADKIVEGLRALSKVMGAKFLQQGTRAAAKTITVAVKAASPVRTGKLRDTTSYQLADSSSAKHRIKQWESGGDASVSYVIGSKAFYIHMVNFGTDHSTGSHYLEKAFAESAPRAVQELEKALLKRLEKEWKKQMPKG